MSPAALTPAQECRFAIVRAVLLGSILGSALTFAVGFALFFFPGVSPTMRAVTWGIFIEMAVSSAVLGAFAKCPACGARLGGQPGKLLPDRCRACGAILTAG